MGPSRVDLDPGSRAPTVRWLKGVLSEWGRVAVRCITMTSGHSISTHAENVHVEVRLDGEVVASAQRPVLLEETGLPTAYYLPKSALVSRVSPMALSTHCPFKGDASYWTIETSERTHDAIAWSYEQPKQGAEDIAGHVAFFSDRAEIVVDGSPV